MTAVSTGGDRSGDATSTRRIPDRMNQCIKPDPQTMMCPLLP